MAIEIDFILHGSDSWLTKDVRKYVSVFSDPLREHRQINEIFEFEETYRSSEFSHSTSMEKVIEKNHSTLIFLFICSEDLI